MENLEFTIGQEVTFASAFGVNVILEIKGKTATVFEKNTNTTSKRRLTSLVKYVSKSCHWTDQELAEGNAKHNHGEIVYSIIENSGNSGVMVWDNIKKQVVNKKELTKA